MEKVNNLLNNDLVKNGLSSVKENYNKASSYLFNENPSILAQTIVGILVCLLVSFILYTVKTIVARIKSIDESSPWIIKDMKDARRVYKVPQNPNLDGSLPLRRSLNEDSGIEFSYVLWILVDDWTYRSGQWKHVFHKGNADSWPNRAPGVWLHPNENKIRVYMNTYNNIGEYVDIDNVPISKWVHLAVILKDSYLDVYVDGFLKKRLQLSGIPKQNFGDLWINANGGFSGYLSRMKYYDYAISFAQLDDSLRYGPSRLMPKEAGVAVTPPYLYSGYWSQN